MPGGQAAGSGPFGKIVEMSGSGRPSGLSNPATTLAMSGSSQPSITAIVVPAPSMPCFHRSPTP